MLKLTSVASVGGAAPVGAANVADMVTERSQHLTLELLGEGRADRDAKADVVIPALRKAGLPER